MELDHRDEWTLVHRWTQHLEQNASQREAGVIELNDLMDDEVPYALAVSGTVTVKRWPKGLKETGDSWGNTAGWGG